MTAKKVASPVLGVMPSASRLSAVEHDVHWYRIQNGMMARQNTVWLPEDHERDDLRFDTGVRVVLPLEGRMDLCIGSHSLNCNGQAAKAGLWLNVVHPAAGSKRFYADSAYRELVLFISHDWLADWCAHLPAVPNWCHQMKSLNAVSFVVTPVMQQLAAQFFALEGMSPVLQHAHRTGLVMQLWLAVIRQMVLEESENSLLRREAQKRINALTVLLHSGEADDWTLAQMAAFSRTNVTTLQRHFQQCHGVSIWHYLRRLKLERAYQSLQAGSTVTQAADCAGYQHLESFSKAFKQQYGCTPIQVRVLQ
ncbi:AraC family transcriptional regulator [Snodgrassella sp. CFCC 13594]|uniref:helix-turn-helix transcriptional regulator n=1 Tax=Snodgrassella sp. CFCC 13594 TaxID=1775559 RepID=UPI00082DE834|nr:AraC family transcriptional regulator [Snodgrassella sp. CFCC 13594]